MSISYTIYIYTTVEDGNHQRETTVQTDDTLGGEDLDIPLMDDDPSAESRSSSGERAVSCPAFLLRILAIFSCCSGDNEYVTVPRSADNFADELEEFIPGMRRLYSIVHSKELTTEAEKRLSISLLAWNIFLQRLQGVRGTCAIISSDITENTNMFIRWMEVHQGAECLKDDRQWINRWFPRWNMFLQARAGETLVTRFNLLLTVVGFILYLVDMGSDIGSAIFFASNAQWWQAAVTLAIVYGAVIIHAAVKWELGRILYTGAVDQLRYVASLLVSWPDVKQYGALCRLEWQLHRSPAKNARLVPEWDGRRGNVALLKFSEGMSEACPQAILQLCLLVPDLYGDWTWTHYLRIAGASVSLCTAGAALVNKEKFIRILDHIDLALSELAVLHVWAVPVTVSRLLSVALLLSVHPYWALAGVALHLVLYGVYYCATMDVSRIPYNVIPMCLETLQFCMSPFAVAGSITYRRVFHAIHLLVNTAATVVWALGTPLVSVHPALYTAIICFNAVMFAVGLVAWQLYETLWPPNSTIATEHWIG